MIASWTNVVSLFVLAFAGAGMLICGRRLLRVIREVERRLAKAVDEKNMIAAALRHAKREDVVIRDAIQEADRHIVLMAVSVTSMEARIEFLRDQPRRVVTLIDRLWNRFDRLWSVKLDNPTLASGRSGIGGWADGKTLYGFARSGDDLRLRVVAQYPPQDGFIAGHPIAVDLVDDVSGAGTVSQSGNNA